MSKEQRESGSSSRYVTMPFEIPRGPTASAMDLFSLGILRPDMAKDSRIILTRTESCLSRLKSSVLRSRSSSGG